MLRIISCLDVKNNIVVKGVKFKKLKNIDSIYNLIIKYEKNNIDEVVILDITSNYTKKSLSYNNLKKILKIPNYPISIGGGINNFEKISKLLKIGADRVVLNSICYENICFLKNINLFYGSQSTIIAIDIKKNFYTYKNSGYINTNFMLLDWVIIVKKFGCGEILLTSIENDGLREGYDLKSLYFIKVNIEISIIASGGLGSINDIYYLYKYCNINSFLIASLLHYNIFNPNYFKKFIKLL